MELRSKRQFSRLQMEPVNIHEEILQSLHMYKIYTTFLIANTVNYNFFFFLTLNKKMVLSSGAN